MRVRRVNVMLNSARVVEPFRDALFEAADEAGLSPSEFALAAAAEKLVREGAQLPGVFKTGDLQVTR